MPTLSSLLLQREVTTMRALEEAIARQVLHGGDLATNLLEIGAVHEGRIVAVLGEAYGLAPAPIGRLPAPEATVLRLVPGELAFRHGIFPLAIEDRTLVIATSEPVAASVEEDLGFALDLAVRQRIAPLVRIRQALAEHYAIALDRRMLRLIARLEGQPDPSPSSMPPANRPSAGMQLPTPASFPPPTFGTGIVSRSQTPPLGSTLGQSTPPGPSVSEIPPRHIPTPVVDAPPVVDRVRVEADAAGPRARATADSAEPPDARAPSREGHPPSRAPGRSNPPALAQLVKSVSEERARGQASGAARSDRPPERRRRRGPYTAAMAERDLADATSSDAVLDVAFQFAQQFFDYAALFVVHGDLAEGRDAVGPGADRARVVGIGVPLEVPSAFAEARERRAPRVGPLRRSGVDAELRRDLGRDPTGAVAVLPVVVRSRVVALVYGDRSDEAVDLASLGDLIAVGGLAAAALERLIVLRKRKGGSPPAARAPAASASARAPAPSAAASPVAPSSPPAGARSSPPVAARSSPPAAGRSSPPVVGRSSPPVAARSPTPASGAKGAPPGGAAVLAKVLADARRASSRPPPAESPKTRVSPGASSVRPPRSSEPGPSPAAQSTPTPSATRHNTQPGPEGTGVVPDKLHDADLAEGGWAASGAGAARSDAPAAAPTNPKDASRQRTLKGIPAARTLQGLPVVGPTPGSTPPGHRARTGADAPDAPDPSGAVAHAKSASDAPRAPASNPPKSNGTNVTSGSAPPAARRSARPIPREEPPSEPGDVAAFADRARSGAARIELPTVVVDVGSEYESLLQLFVDRASGSDEAFDALVKHGDAVMPLINMRFPGPVQVDRHRLRDHLPPASQCGPILQLAIALGRVALPFVTVRSASSDAELRFWATHALGELPFPEAANALVPRLFDEDVSIRRVARRAATSLVEAGEAGQPIIQGLDFMIRSVDEPTTRRVTAIDTAGDIRSGSLVPALIAVLGDGSRDVADAARRALVLVTRQDFAHDARKWTDWWAASGSRHRIEWLIDALLHDVPSIRRAAGDELKQLTKEYFGYYDDLPKRERERAQARYREWWDVEGKLRFR